MAGARAARAQWLDAAPSLPSDVHIVFLPMLPGDDLDAARAAAELFAGSPARIYWDERRTLSARLADVLQLKRTRYAWDIYLRFDPAAVFTADGTPPAPADWVHQMHAGPPARHVRPDLDTALRRIVAQR